MNGFPRGRLCWHELMTSDTAAAAAFYPKITGWTTKPWPDDPSYTLWMNGADMVGGLMPIPEQARQMGASPSWTAYVAMQDAEGTTFRAEALGATVVNAVQEVPSVGRFAVLKDPYGAVFAILQPAAQVPGHDGEPRRGEFSWHELATTDWDGAMSFYSALFGWERADAVEIGPMGTYQLFARGGRNVGGIFNKPPEVPAPPHWLCYIKVANADSAVARIKQAGGRLAMGPMEVPGGNRVAQAVDPQGAMFAVDEVAAKPVAAPPARPAAPRPAAPRPAAPTPAAPRPAAPRPAAPTPPAPRPAAVRPAAPRAAAPAKQPAVKRAAKKKPAKKTAKRKPVKKAARKKKR
jgi:predicted enzyme related to lactoylglutathione lyase